MLIGAATLAIIIGLIHSYLGERYILVRLFKRENLPKLFGSDWFTKRVLRFAWHLTTIAWWGFAAILYILSGSDENTHQQILITIAVVFLVSGVLSATFTKGRHLSWIIFWSISGICFYAAMQS